MIQNFSNKLSFEPKQIVFVKKVYTLKTDHKTGLMIQALMKEQPDGVDEQLVKLALGEKQQKELYTELELSGKEQGSENWTENFQAIVMGIMSMLYNKPYEEFEQAAANAAAANAGKQKPPGTI